MFQKIALLMLIVVMSLSFMGSASAKVYVHGYTKKNGTHVAPHYRSNPDHSFKNNWSTKGNTNPITGKKGYKTHP
ncbi:hypothetical protein SAMN03159358_2194 [Paenibacillus sp. NFR01]|nr:hypothetical protein SAMN03159358_2194 [Paenibacillus sp. NFR01]